MVTRCSGEWMALSQTGHVTTSNKGPVATYTHTGTCFTGFLIQVCRRYADKAIAEKDKLI